MTWLATACSKNVLARSLKACYAAGSSLHKTIQERREIVSIGLKDLHLGSAAWHSLAESAVMMS